MNSKIDRRNFIQLGALSAAGLALGVSASPASLAAPGKKKINPSDKITVGMIAVGARAQQMMGNIQNIPEAEIVAVCDAYAGRVERAISRTGGRAVDMKTCEKIIDDPSIDVVVISSPDHLHASQIIAAMNKGKHVYIEKPLTYTVDEGVEIIKSAKKNKVAVQVGSSGISSALARKAKEIIASGKLGQVTMIRASYNRNTASGAWIYPIPPDANKETVNWDMFQGPAKKRPFDLERFFRWRCYQDYSGGMSTDLFVHLCNSIHYVMGVEMCNSAIGMGALYRWKESRDVPDTLNASLEYPEGFMVNLSGTFNNSLSDDVGGVRILGTEGTLIMGRELTFIPENVVNDNGWIVDSWPRKLQEDYYNDPKVKEEERPNTQSQKVIPGTETYVSRGIDSTTAHFQDLFDAVKNGSMKTIEDASVGHHAAACAHMVNVSIEKGKIVHWDKQSDNIKKT
jgi:predicted dehydrogenase